MSPANNNDIVIEGRKLGTAHRLSDLDVFTVQLPYKLNQTDFIYLKNRRSWSERFAPYLYGSFIAYGLLVVGKLLYCGYRAARGITSPGSPVIDAWEIWVLALSFVGSCVGLALCKYMPSERKVIVQNIKKHFEDNPVFDEIRRKTR